MKLMLSNLRSIYSLEVLLSSSHGPWPFVLICSFSTCYCILVLLDRTNCVRTLCSSCCWSKRANVLGLCRAVSHTSTSHLLTWFIQTTLCTRWTAAVFFDVLRPVCISELSEKHIITVTTFQTLQCKLNVRHSGLDKLLQTVSAALPFQPFPQGRGDSTGTAWKRSLLSEKLGRRP